MKTISTCFRSTTILGLLASLAAVNALAMESRTSAPKELHQVASASTLGSVSREANSVSTVSVSSRSGISLESFALTYKGTYHGPALGSVDRPYTVDRTGKRTATSTMYVDSEAAASYLITPTVGVGPVVPFYIYPVLGKGMSLGDVGVRAFNAQTVSSGGFNLATNLILQMPTSDDSKTRHMSFAIKTTPSVRYRLTASRFTVGSWTEAKAYLGVTQGKTFKLWAAPYVSYRVSPSVAFQVLYEMEAHHYVGKDALDFTSYQTDLQPGVIWNVSSKIMVNPYVQVFTGNRVTRDSTAIGALITASVI